MLLLLAVSADETTEVATVIESTISVAEHARRYVEPGVGNAAPLVLVYSAKGRCVAVFGETVRGRLASAVADAGTRTKKECAVLPSHTAGSDVTEGEQRVSVELLVFDMPFCGACDALRNEFNQLAKAKPENRYLLTKVNFGKEFNAQKASSHAPRTDGNTPPPR